MLAFTLYMPQGNPLLGRLKEFHHSTLLLTYHNTSVHLVYNMHGLFSTLKSSCAMVPSKVMPTQSFEKQKSRLQNATASLVVDSGV